MRATLGSAGRGKVREKCVERHKDGWCTRKGAHCCSYFKHVCVCMCVYVCVCVCLCVFVCVRMCVWVRFCFSEKWKVRGTLKSAGKLTCVRNVSSVARREKCVRNVLSDTRMVGVQGRGHFAAPTSNTHVCVWVCTWVCVYVCLCVCLHVCESEVHAFVKSKRHPEERRKANVREKCVRRFKAWEMCEKCVSGARMAGVKGRGHNAALAWEWGGGAPWWSNTKTSLLFVKQVWERGPCYWVWR